MAGKRELIGSEERRAEEQLLPSVWAERHRRIGGRPWTFAGREFLRRIHDDMSRHVVVKKAAQLGFTEFAQNRLAHSCDFSTSAMLVLATDDDAKRHSKARFKELCQSSPYIRDMFKEVDSVDVKRALDAALYFEGSNSRSALYSVPVGLLIVDEVDRCVPDALEAATHRLDGHASPCELWISTPTYHGHGIDKAFAASDQKRWVVACPRACGWSGALDGPAGLESWEMIRWDEWPATNVDDPHVTGHSARIECPKCAHRWTERERKSAVAAGAWVASNPGHPVSGYAINQLYSPTVTVVDLVTRYLQAVADPSPEKLRQFVNQSLGLAYMGDGEDVKPSDVRACLVPATARPWPATCLGVDVGKVFHVALGGKDGDALIAGKCFTVASSHELERVIRAENAASVVIDRFPEERLTEDLCRKFPNVVYRSYHPEGMKSQYNWDAKTSTVQIAHAPAADLLLSRARRGSEMLRIHKVGDFDEVVKHVAAIGVVLAPEGKNGELVRRVVKKGPDHFAFALIYLEAAASRFVTTGGGSFGGEAEVFADASDDSLFADADPIWSSEDRADDPNVAWRDF